MTTWDGQLRIDHLADAGTVVLTLITVEPATEMRLRAGLVAEFVAADLHGPPASVVVALQNGRLPWDVAQLLGARVSAAVADLLGAGRSGQWLDLDLVEVDNLAVAWAPYRVVTLAPASASTGALGVWADELWTCLGVRGWRDALRALSGPAPAVGTFRGDDPALADALQGTWRLPDELAAVVGVEPEVTWSLRRTEQDAIEIDLRARSSGRPARAVLQAGLDDRSQRWAPFETEGSGGLRARLAASEEAVSVRFRSETRRTS
ncbi:hypothetical protein [Actinokineospora pegani]|uniref:hypothetical protein n=1 Tax=Actinokineospora pegani TaxID=2654637 RepID=UPI0012EA54CB|nr:hypothetical protein [Actinokineospora pegani]